MQLSVIIVNWNAGSLLSEALASISKYHQGLVATVIIVDNASSDNSLAEVEDVTSLPYKLQIVRNNDNRGFGAACNQGAALSNSSYFLFLNPDARIYSATLSNVLNFMSGDNNAKVGICGVQLLDETDSVSRSCARFPNSLSFMSHAIGIDRMLPILGHSMGEWNHGDTREVDHVIGAFYFVRRELFEALNGFDERFFVYLEDLDFSCRSKKLGWKCVYIVQAQAFHLGGGTSNQYRARRLFYSLRSRLLYSIKHFTAFGSASVIFATLFLEPLTRSFLAIMRFSWPGLVETWNAYCMLWDDIGPILKSRRL